MKIMAIIILLCTCIILVGSIAYLAYIGGPQLLDQIADARDEWRAVIARFKGEE